MITITIEQLWSDYRDHCYPEGIAERQEAETKQAFFSGVLAFLATTTCMTDCNSDKDVEEWLCRVRNELHDYGRLRSISLTDPRGN